MPNSRNDDFEFKEFDNEALRLFLKHRSSQFPVLEITSPSKGVFKENNTITVAGSLWSDNFDTYGTGSLVQNFYIKTLENQYAEKVRIKLADNLSKISKVHLANNSSITIIIDSLAAINNNILISSPKANKTKKPIKPWYGQFDKKKF